MDRNGPSDEQIELLLTGAADVPEGLVPIATAFTALREDATHSIDVEAITTAAAKVASEVGSPRAPMAPIGRPLLSRLRQRAAAVAVGATVMLGSMSGLAVAADDAKPGDFLYGIDRAFEVVGVGNGSSSERIDEAEALIEAGDVPRGLRHAAEAVENDKDSSGASAALLRAADRVRSGGSEQSAATRDQVAGLLSYLSENAGSIDGQQVAELAREIGGPKHEAGSPGNAPADNPGRSSNTPGPPEHSPADPPGHAEDKPGNRSNDD